MFGLSFLDLSLYSFCKKETHTTFFAIVCFSLLQSSCHNVKFFFEKMHSYNSITITLITQVPALNLNNEVTCEYCATQTTELNLARHKKRCSVGTLLCTQYPIFSKKNPNDLHYQSAKKHNDPQHDVTFNCELFHEEFSGFKAGDNLNKNDNANLREKLRSCQFSVLDSELERATH